VGLVKGSSDYIIKGQKMRKELFYSAYLSLYRAGILKERTEQAYQILEKCRLCPRNCGVNRLKGEKGFCRAESDLVVASAHSHFGEEPPISGHQGSGTIFFSYCNLRCVFCQNYPISHLGNGNCISVEKLAEMMVMLQGRGCHNINLVTPTHFMPQILSALSLAIEEGLHIPLVYNCGGYESLEALRLLEGVVDIYLPDIKYGNENSAKKYSNAPGYFKKAKEAIKEMYNQVGNLQLDKRGVARRGLLVRHLVLPNGIAATREVFSFLAREISPRIYVSIMSQYFPTHQAKHFPELNRRITPDEYEEAMGIAEELNLEKGWKQG